MSGVRISQRTPYYPYTSTFYIENKKYERKVVKLKRNSNDKKSEQLGMSYGKAGNILRKNLLFYLAQKSGMDICFQCKKPIKSVDDFSIEHKVPWLDSNNPVELFFSMENIAFSHSKCNILSSNRSVPRLVKNSTGYRGVNHRKNTNLFRAVIYHNGNRYHSKYFKDAVEAAKEYDRMALELFGENAVTNKSLGLY